MNAFSSNIEPIARAICENSARALWNGEPERLASHVERCWHCVAAELSYARKMVTALSGGFDFVLDPVAEFNPFDDFGQAVLTIEFMPFLLG